MRRVFTIEERNAARERVLAQADADPRVVAGAEVGSLALGGGDRWSDLDLTFALEDGTAIDEVLADWTQVLTAELDAVHLFDLPSGPAIYRVFLLPDLLQLDVSFAPASEFRPRGPKFRLLFGDADEPAFPSPPAAERLFGLAAHHAVRARFCIERGRYWQAERWIAEVREQALTLACLRLGLPWSYARGLDDLPAEVLAGAKEALARSLEQSELLRALEAAVDCLLRERAGAGDLAARLEPDLRNLARARL
jgi:hypothetical protein